MFKLLKQFLIFFLFLHHWPTHPWISSSVDTSSTSLDHLLPFSIPSSPIDTTVDRVFCQQLKQPSLNHLLPPTALRISTSHLNCVCNYPSLWLSIIFCTEEFNEISCIFGLSAACFLIVSTNVTILCRDLKLELIFILVFADISFKHAASLLLPSSNEDFTFLLDHEMLDQELCYLLCSLYLVKI